MGQGIDPDTPGWGLAAAALVIVATCFIWLAFGR